MLYMINIYGFIYGCYGGKLLDQYWVFLFKNLYCKITLIKQDICKF